MHNRSIISSFMVYTVSIAVILTAGIGYAHYTLLDDSFTEQVQRYRLDYIEQRKNTIRNEVRIVVSRIRHRIERLKKSPKPDAGAARQELLDWIGTIRLRANQYITVNTYNGIMLAHYRKDRIGRNMWNWTDRNGVKPIQEAARVAQANGRGFIRYVGSIRPTTGRPAQKILYVENVPEWKWIVGTGVYLDDIEEAIAAKRIQFRKDMTANLVKLAAILFLSMVGLALAAKSSANKLKRSISHLSSYFDTAAEELKPIEPDALTYDEFRDVTLSVNRMIDDIVQATSELRGEIKQREEVEKILREHQRLLGKMSYGLSLAEERERRLIATELHDHIGQNLALGKMKLQALHRSVNDLDLRTGLKEIGDLLGSMVLDTRALTLELSPPILYEIGLSDALDWLVETYDGRYEATITYSSGNHLPEIDENLSVTMFRAAREILINAIKHSQASKIEIALSYRDANLVLEVRDDGIGSDGADMDYSRIDYRSGYGLLHINQKVTALGGELEIDTAPDRGFAVTMRIPLPEQPPTGS